MSSLQKIVVLGVVAIVLVGGFFLFNSNTKEQADEEIADIPEVGEPAQEENTPQPEPSPVATLAPTVTTEPTLAPTPTSEPTLTPTPTSEPTPQPSPTPTPTPMPTPTPEPTLEPKTIIYTTSGYSPSTLAVAVGTKVVFKNQSTASMWPASNTHPSHTAYPGSSINKCEGSESDTIFDACRSIQPGEEWSFIFTEQCTWLYHDHDRPSRGGTITVE